MAGTTPGATAPTHTLHEPDRTAAAGLAPRLAPSTRTRRNHGAFIVGGHLATVYSSRRQASAGRVLLQLGGGALIFSGAMTADQARAIAQALTVAATAADAQQGVGAGAGTPAAGR